MPFASHLDGFQDVGDQLARHLLARAERALAAGAREREAVATPEAFTAYRRRWRRRFLAALGGLPPRPAVVPGRLAGTVAAEDCLIERLLLETLPGVLATANLYLPPRRDGPVPGVLFLCGHAREAKAHPAYQRVCRRLVRAGMAVLALDPVGQGERMQYVAADGRLLVDWGTAEHAHVGLQCTVTGFHLARYLVADAMQALSYLAARPEIDGSRLGVTGNSGGGTQAAYLCFLDERLACGAICTYLTSTAAFLGSGLAHDAEQNLWGLLAKGFDFPDLAMGLAPRPLLLGAVASDYFPIEGMLETYTWLRRLYGLYGRQENVQLVVGPGPHQYSAVLREATAAFFRRHLLGAATALPPGPQVYAGPDESPLPAVSAAHPDAAGAEPVLPPAALQVTRTGQVVLDHPSARTVFALQREAWQQAASPRLPSRSGTGRGGAAARWARLRRAVLAQRPRPPLWVRETASGVEAGIAWSHRYTFSEPGIALPLLLLQPPGDTDGPLTVVGIPEGTAAVGDPARRAELEWLLGVHGRLLLFDPRGTGAAAQRPLNPAPYAGRFGTLYVLNHLALQLRDSLLAMQAFDALRAIEYAHRLAPTVHVVGRGAPALVLLLAAALDGRVRGGRLAALPRSLAELMEAPLYAADLAWEAHGLLSWPDMDELATRVPGLELVDALPLTQPAPPPA